MKAKIAKNEMEKLSTQISDALDNVRESHLAHENILSQLGEELDGVKESKLDILRSSFLSLISIYEDSSNVKSKNR